MMKLSKWEKILGKSLHQHLWMFFDVNGDLDHFESRLDNESDLRDYALALRDLFDGELAEAKARIKELEAAQTGKGE